MRTIVVMAVFAVAVAGCDQVQNLHGGNPHAPAAAHAEQSGVAAIDLQGGRMDCSEAGVRGFYDISVEAFANGAEKVDLEAYKQKTFTFMREGMNREGIEAKQIDAWIDHIKDIPRQMIGIVKDDPKVLETCEAFSMALSGPP
jgi:hypothetical protein